MSAIKLRGFKSFPDPVEVRLERGVAVVVGPNGSGKSNVSDALLWASGSLSPSELRAEKPDDVLFAGSAGRPAADWCEVELLFDNADGQFPELEFSEISIPSRLQSGCEGQYLVNRGAVRRTDLVELLAGVGLGGGHSSVIGQGRVEEILSSKPEHRRALLEEAAGLGKFKARRHRAELKLARVQVQAERARDLDHEIRKRLRPLALQATAAERAEKLKYELASVEARIAELELEELGQAAAEIEERRTAATMARKAANAKLEDLLVERNRAEEDLADAAGRREEATAALYRLRSAADRLELRREAAEALVERLRGQAHAAGLGNLTVLVGARPAELMEHYAVVSKAELLSSPVPAVTPEGFGYDPERGELWFAGETAEAVWLELEARRRGLAAEIQRLQENPAAPPPAADPRLVAAGERLVRAPGGAGEAGHRAGAPRR